MGVQEVVKRFLSIPYDFAFRYKYSRSFPKAANAWLSIDLLVEMITCTSSGVFLTSVLLHLLTHKVDFFLAFAYPILLHMLLGQRVSNGWVGQLRVICQSRVKPLQFLIVIKEINQLTWH